MRIKKLSLLLAAAVCACALAGCGGAAEPASSAAVASEAAAVSEAASVAASAASSAAQQPALADGIYTAEFVTDSTMFHANEACEGKGTLTVKDGEMTFHVSLVSKSILNLYVGTAENAQKAGAELLEPTVDTVTYSDGLSEEVYGFDIPVEKLDTDFAVAIYGKKGKWYDHTVSVCNAQPAEAEVETEAAEYADGSYTCEVQLAGGSGKATIASPAALTIRDGAITATIVWSSKNYDYMLVNGQKYLPTNTEGNSTFEIPVTSLSEPLGVVGDTVAMSTPHEVEYTITFDSSTLQAVE